MRMAFTSGKTSPYDRKKYIWKLVYINMMGYDVDFGHVEMISLVSSPTYAEKLVGYMSTAVMLRNTDPQITLVVQAIKTDLQSTQDPVQCLALCAIANIGGRELAEAVTLDVSRILFSRSIFPVVRKKAALCLLRLSRISRELLPAEEYGKKLTPLLEDKNTGVVLAVVTLILGLAERDRRRRRERLDLGPLHGAYHAQAERPLAPGAVHRSPALDRGWWPGTHVDCERQPRPLGHCFRCRLGPAPLRAARAQKERAFVCRREGQVSAPRRRRQRWKR